MAGPACAVGVPITSGRLTAAAVKKLGRKAIIVASWLIVTAIYGRPWGFGK
jgi:hypothetical protein